MSIADELKGKSVQPNQPQRPTRPNAPGGSGKSKSSGLAQQNLKELAVDLVRQQDQNLNELAAAILAHEGNQAIKFVDFVEQLQDSTVVTTLIAEELERRAATRQQAEVILTIDTSASGGFEMRSFETKPNMIRTLTGQAFTKALEGI